MIPLVAREALSNGFAYMTLKISCIYIVGVFRNRVLEVWKFDIRRRGGDDVLPVPLPASFCLALTINKN